MIKRTEREQLMWMLYDSWQGCTLDDNGNYINYKDKLIEILIDKVLKLEEENRGNMNTYQWTSGEELKLILDEADRLTEGVNIDDVKL